MNWLLGWSKVEKIESGGRYPLGLNRFHSGLDDLLIKSITEQANRLRYITYYCWVIGDIHKNTKNLTYVEFVRRFQLLENALTVGLYLFKPDASFYGKENLKVKASKEQTECKLNFQLMQSNLLGGFGLYFVGPMQNLGLLEINNAGIYSLTQKGEELYEIYNTYLSVHKTDYYQSFKDKEIVPANILLEWGEINDLDNIAEDSSIKERDIYKQLYFRLEKKETTDFRRQTLSLFIEAIIQCQKNNADFSETTLKNIHYFQKYRNRENKIITFNLPESLNEVIFYWKVYEGHGYFRGWLEKYLQMFLIFLKAHDDGATFDDFFNSFDMNEVNSSISSYTGQTLDYVQMSIDELLALHKSNTPLESLLSEESLMPNDKTDTNNSLVAKYFMTMIVIIGRFHAIRSDKRYLFIQDRRMGDLWFDKLYYIPGIRKITGVQFLTLCLKEYVIQQHDLIMYEKRDLRKCWFTTENDKFFFQADAEPIWRPAKYRTIMNFLRDMNLIEKENNTYIVTDEGNELYWNLKENYLYE